ncbi:MAG: response regulator [Nitrospirae bacterium]|nr:MAG: response regulator [Nitrospirota bacterium]
MATILVIEDDDQTRHLIREILEQAHHTVIEAKNGDEGIKRFHRAPTDLIITDILMPEKEGLETIRELRREYPGINIIAISGGTERAHLNILDIARKLGATQTILKPFSMHTLLNAVHAALAGPASSQDSSA